MEKIKFQEYPDLKLGFTTQNFLQAMPVTLDNSRLLIDYADSLGFDWLELRDPDATLSLEECTQISSYARQKDIEVSYAIQKGLLDEDFWPTFERGVINATAFQSPKIIRSLASGVEISGDENRKGWTAEELERVVQRADSAAALAKENGLQYVIENGAEAFFGDGEYYGIADAFDRVGEDVGWQFDTANPFSVSRSHASADSVNTFLRDHADNLFYIHLKSAQEGAAQPMLTDNPLALGDIFQVMAAHDVKYVAIELQSVADRDEAFANMQKSLDYLKSQQFISQ